MTAQVLSFLSRIFVATRDAFLNEAQRWILWLPVLVGAGALLYFRLPVEPNPVWPRVALTALVLLRFASRSPALGPPTVAVLAVVSGIAAAQWETNRVAAPVLTRNLYADVSARVVAVEPQPRSVKVVLDHVTSATLLPGETPQRMILYSFRKDLALHPGERLTARMSLRPPPRAVLPGGYDMARHYYFNGVGAVATLSGTPVIAPAETMGLGDRLLVAQYGLRQRIANAIHARMPMPEAAVAVSLITGDQSAIDDDTMAAMRASGLSHILSVSGLHMALFSGITFWLVRLCLALIPGLALHYDIKRWAALAALLASFGYLVITAFPVPAVRSFITVFFVLLALLAGREPTPMRSLAWAALLILLYDPASVLGPSFQMSFAATVALVAMYESIADRPSPEGGRGVFSKGVRWLVASMLTSFVAGLATAPYVVYHFQQANIYGTFANLLVGPLAAFLMMPAVVAFFPLALLHLLPLALTPMEWGVHGMLIVARWVEGWPGSSLSLPPLTDAGLLLVSLGGLWLLLWRSGLRWLGVPLIVAGMLTVERFDPPDILVDDRLAHVAVRLDDGRLVMVRGQGRGFVAENWQRWLGNLPYARRSETPVACTRQVCRVRVKNTDVAVYIKSYTKAEDCLTDVQLILAPWPLDAECKTAPMVDWKAVQRTGAQGLWVEGGKLVRQRTASDGRQRPWSRKE